MIRNTALTKGIIKCIVLLVFSAGSLLLSLWIGDSMATLFNSVLDRYLNYTESMLYLWASVIDRIFFLVFLILLLINVVKIIKHKKLKRNIAQIIFIFLFIIINTAFLVAVTSLQATELKTVNSISVKSYVDIHQVFDVSDNDDSYSEQTNYGKVNSEVPVNYEVQQMTSEYIAQTSCIQIIDNSLLSKYYEEQRERVQDCTVKDLTDLQLKNISADMGCYWSDNNNTLNILIIKNDVIFHIYLSGEHIRKDLIVKELNTL